MGDGMKLAKKYFIFETLKNISIVSLILFFFIKSISFYTLELSKAEVNKIGRYFNDLIVTKNLIYADRFYETFIKNEKLLESVEKEDIESLKDFLDLSNVDIVEIYNNKNIILFNKTNTMLGNYQFLEKIRQDIIDNLESSSDVFYIGDSKYGIYGFKKFKIHHKGRNIGNLIVGFDVSSSKYIQEINEKFALDATVFYENTRVNTSVKINDKVQIGTTLDEKISNEIYNEKKVYNDEVDVLGKRYMSVYIPIFDDKSSKGAIFIGKAMEEIYKDIYRISLLLSILTLAVTVSISYFLYYKIKNKYIKAIVDVDNHMQEFVSDKDKLEFNPDGDEIASLKSSFLVMKKSISTYEEELKYQIYHDSLTKLKNIAYLQETFDSTDDSNGEIKALKQMDLSNAALYLLNLDNISSINRTLGAGIGDKVLIKVSKVISNFLIPFGLEPYKYIGNKFIIILPHKDLFSPNDILALFSEPFEFKENKLSISLSIGVCNLNNNYENILEILKDANIALNFAKNESIHKLRYFDVSMRDRINETFEIENELKRALKEKEFYLNYQPKVDCKTKKVLGFEALVRWRHPTKGIIPPIKFIDIAESTGLIIPLGKWIIKESILFIQKLNKEKGTNFHIAINISIIQLIQEDFNDFIEEFLEKNNVRAEFIHFEITESVFIQSYSTIANKLNRIRELGIKIDLDDFGTGYSSLNHLMNLPIDSLKIDKSFIDNVFEKNSFILEIINIGKRIGLTVVAEGVETEEHLGLMDKYNCDIIQGYIFSKPLIKEELLSYLEKNGY